MSHEAVDSRVDHRVVSFLLMFHHRRSKGILPERERNDPPSRDEENQPHGRNNGSRLLHHMKSKNIQRNEAGQTTEYRNKQEHHDLVRRRLSFLDERLKAFVEQLLPAGKHDHHCRDINDEEHAEEYPGTPPLPRPCRQE